MTKLTELKASVRLLLEDASAARFSDNLLQTALRQALDGLNARLPLLKSLDFLITTPGRDQALSGLNGCRYLVSLDWITPAGVEKSLEAGSQFSYLLLESGPVLHFSGADYPQPGDTLNLRYAADHTIEGLDGATTTSLAASCETALVNGAAGHACRLRAASLVERPGSRLEDTARLVEIGRLWLEAFERGLGSLRILQDFGFPPGFSLDQWDMRGG